MMYTNKKGFSLVEVLAAMIIAAIMLVGILQICTSSYLTLQDLKFRSSATNIAMAQIEDVKAFDYETIPIATYNPSEVVNVLIDEGNTVGAGDDTIGVMTTMVRDATVPPNQGRKIIVQVSWNFSGQAKNETMEAFVYSRR